MSSCLDKQHLQQKCLAVWYCLHPHQLPCSAPQVYKQKVKHLLYEHQNNITELKRDGTVAVTLEQSQHQEKEDGLRKEKRSLKVELKEMELAHQEAVKTLKMVSPPSVELILA